MKLLIICLIGSWIGVGINNARKIDWEVIERFVRHKNELAQKDPDVKPMLFDWKLKALAIMVAISLGPLGKGFCK